MFIRIHDAKGDTYILSKVVNFRVHKDHSELHVAYSDGELDILSQIKFAEVIEFDAIGKKK